MAEPAPIVERGRLGAMGQSLSAITAVVDRQGATSVCTTLCLSVAARTNVLERVSGWLAVEVKQGVRDAAGVQAVFDHNRCVSCVFAFSLHTENLIVYSELDVER